jgi:1,2-diacylglycerol 3-alpha-glucosyltransferase
MFKRIVFISVFQIGYGGGDGRVAHEMAAHFSAGYDAVLLCPGPDTGLSETAGLKVFSVQSSGDGHFLIPLLTQRNIRKIYAFLEEFRPDIIHAHDPTLLSVIVQVWARMSRVPFVYTAHVLPAKILDFALKEVVRLPVDFLAEPVTRGFLEDFYLNCDAVVALNSIAARGIREFGYAGRLFVIPNGRDLRHYAACRPADITQQRKILTFVGFITRRKNQVYLLEMLKHLPPEYSLRLIGEPLDPDYKDQLEAYAAANRLDNVEFAGSVRYENIPAYYEASHVLVSASKMEVQSLVVIEALASGTPVVGLSNETVDELVDEGDGAWLPKDSPPPEFAATVVRLCTLPQAEYERLCQHARYRVRHLDWANVTQQAVEMYDWLIREKAAAARSETARPARLMLPRLGPVTHSLESRVGPVLKVPPKLGSVADSLAGRVNALRLPRRLNAAIRSLETLVRRVRRVRQRTWLFAGLTAAASVVVYAFLRSRPRGSGPSGGVS